MIMYLKILSLENLLTLFLDVGVVDDAHGRELLPLSPRARDSCMDPLGHLLPPAERPKRTAADYRTLWKTAIHQQILLLRMEKENQRLEGELLPLFLLLTRMTNMKNVMCKRLAVMRSFIILFFLSFSYL